MSPPGAESPAAGPGSGRGLGGQEEPWEPTGGREVGAGSRRERPGAVTGSLRASWDRPQE